MQTLQNVMNQLSTFAWNVDLVLVTIWIQRYFDNVDHR
jgi:hypothetical protein